MLNLNTIGDWLEGPGVSFCPGARHKALHGPVYDGKNLDGEELHVFEVIMVSNDNQW